MLEGKRRFQPKQKFRKKNYTYVRKSNTYHYGYNKKGHTVIETIIDDSNKENETPDINLPQQEPQKEECVDKPIEKDDNAPKSPIINLSNETLKEAFYFPKKLATVYKMIASSKTLSNVYKPTTIERTMTTVPPKKHSDDTQSSEYECSSDIELEGQDTPYNYTRDHNSACFSLKYQQPFNPMLLNTIQQQQQQQRKAMDLIINQEQFRLKENTEILSLKVKVSDNQFIYCKIRRFDDLFMTIKVFCEINQIDSRLIKPLILEVFVVLNSIYATMNTPLIKEDINYLDSIRSLAVE